VPASFWYVKNPQNPTGSFTKKLDLNISIFRKVIRHPNVSVEKEHPACYICSLLASALSTLFQKMGFLENVFCMQKCLKA